MASRWEQQRDIERRRRRIEKLAFTQFRRTGKEIFASVLEDLGKYRLLGKVGAADLKRFQLDYRNSLELVVDRSAKAAITIEVANHGDALSKLQISRLPPSKEIARKYMKRYGLRRINGIMKTQRAVMNHIIQQNITAGEVAIAEALQERMPGIIFNQARVVARTETGRALNSSQVEVGKDISKVTGRIMLKIWVANQGERTREAHANADGQTVQIDSPFMVGGEQIQYPGDGSAANSINCRCTIAQQLSKKK